MSDLFETIAGDCDACCDASPGHRIHAAVSLRTLRETVAVAEAAGFRLQNAASTLLRNPDEPVESPPRPEDGAAPRAGFVALAFLVHATAGN